MKSQLIEKTLMLGRIESRREKGVMEEEMTGGHHPHMDMSLSNSWG